MGRVAIIGGKQSSGERFTTVDSMVRLIVEDEGPGVPVDQLESIFRRNFSSRPAEGRSMQMDISSRVSGEILMAASPTI